jgi:hypothetical protein
LFHFSFRNYFRFAQEHKRERAVMDTRLGIASPGPPSAPKRASEQPRGRDRNTSLARHAEKKFKHRRSLSQTPSFRPRQLIAPADRSRSKSPGPASPRYVFYLFFFFFFCCSACKGIPRQACRTRHVDIVMMNDFDCFGLKNFCLNEAILIVLF